MGHSWLKIKSRMSQCCDRDVSVRGSLASSGKFSQQFDIIPTSYFLLWYFGGNMAIFNSYKLMPAAIGHLKRVLTKNPPRHCMYTSASRAISQKEAVTIKLGYSHRLAHWLAQTRGLQLSVLHSSLSVRLTSYVTSRCHISVASTPYILTLYSPIVSINQVCLIQFDTESVILS